MRLIRRPWTWFLRFRKRRGYGVHSPSAFAFITGVVHEQSAYYAYAPLSRLHPWWVRWGKLYPMTCRRLLFRLANYVHPSTITLLGASPTDQAYLSAAVPTAHINPVNTIYSIRPRPQAPTLFFIAAAHLQEAPAIAATLQSGDALILEGIHSNRDARSLWKTMKANPHTGITFDLYTYGIVFFDTTPHKQHYLVNF